MRFQGATVLDRLSTTVNPLEALTPFVQRYTGITQADVDASPPFGDVAPRLVDFVGEAPIVGHNLPVHALLPRPPRRPISISGSRHTRPGIAPGAALADEPGRPGGAAGGGPRAAPPGDDGCPDGPRRLRRPPRPGALAGLGNTGGDGAGGGGGPVRTAAPSAGARGRIGAHGFHRGARRTGPGETTVLSSRPVGKASTGRRSARRRRWRAFCVPTAHWPPCCRPTRHVPSRRRCSSPWPGPSGPRST